MFQGLVSNFGDHRFGAFVVLLIYRADRITVSLAVLDIPIAVRRQSE
jgi:hypothetical protein